MPVYLLSTRSPVLSHQLLSHYRSLSRQPLTVVDVETTGRYPSSSRIMEISVLQATLTEGIQHQQTHLIDPQVSIPAKISRFTGITQTMVSSAPTASQVLLAYLPLLSSGVLTGHNLEFDYSFLQAELGRLDTEFTRPDAEQLCTVQLARLMLPDLPSRRLPDLVQHFRFQVGKSHRAEADTLACWLLAKQLLTEINTEEDEVLLARFARQWLPLKYAARVLGCSELEGRLRLAEADIASRFVGRGTRGTWMYRRGDVERVAESDQLDESN
ncbi:3'-5' exonuclease [Phormidium tenue FACHB-886]|nr:3'-5' exonuclease [Phormidium tenue FACHB-886]